MQRGLLLKNGGGSSQVFVSREHLKDTAGSLKQPLQGHSEPEEPVGQAREVLPETAACLL